METLTVTAAQQEIAVKYWCRQATLVRTCYLLHRGENKRDATDFFLSEEFLHQNSQAERYEAEMLAQNNIRHAK